MSGNCGCNPTPCTPLAFCAPENFGLLFPSLVGPEGPMGPPGPPGSGGGGGGGLTPEQLAAIALVEAATPNSTPDQLVLRDGNGNATFANLTLDAIGALLTFSAGVPVTLSATNVSLLQAATALNSPGNIVVRDGSGNF